jgi:hypothetical protein
LTDPSSASGSKTAASVGEIARRRTEEEKRRRSSSASDDDGGGFSMFAPPICRRRWRNNAFRSAKSDEDGGNPANIAINTARLRERLKSNGN